jgi:hypothetical protein
VVRALDEKVIMRAASRNSSETRCRSLRGVRQHRPAQPASACRSACRTRAGCAFGFRNIGRSHVDHTDAWKATWPILSGPIDRGIERVPGSIPVSQTVSSGAQKAPDDTNWDAGSPPGQLAPQVPPREPMHTQPLSNKPHGASVCRTLRTQRTGLARRGRWDRCARARSVSRADEWQGK